MSRSNILRFFLPFSATVFSYLPFDRRTHRQLLGFLYLTQCMVKDMSHSKWFMHEKVLRRVMSRIIRLFGDDELLFVLQSLNKCKAHNHIALTSALCGTLPKQSTMLEKVCFSSDRWWKPALSRVSKHNSKESPEFLEMKKLDRNEATVSQNLSVIMENPVISLASTGSAQ